MITVKAKSTGYFNGRRREGEQFEIDNKDQLGSWMKVVDGSGEKPAPKKVSAKKKGADSTKAAKPEDETPKD